ncbi:hypothetical protein EES44_19105 [Streptomyces sp. ADI96-15]|nr:hypothetical protein EES44_19105 [Streptomyces sp. ADI96-15]
MPSRQEVTRSRGNTSRTPRFEDVVTAVARQQLLHLAERPDESAADGEEGQGQHGAPDAASGDLLGDLDQPGVGEAVLIDEEVATYVFTPR